MRPTCARACIDDIWSELAIWEITRPMAEAASLETPRAAFVDGEHGRGLKHDSTRIIQITLWSNRTPTENMA